MMHYKSFSQIIFFYHQILGTEIFSKSLLENKQIFIQGQNRSFCANFLNFLKNIFSLTYITRGNQYVC